MTQPGTAGTSDDPIAKLITQEVTVNGQTVTRLVGIAFDSATASDGVLRFDGLGSTNGITDGSAKVLVNGTVHDVAGGEWVDQSGTSHTLDSWEKVINSQFDVTVTGTNGPVAPGNNLDVTADVTNNGTGSDTQDATLDIDNSVGEVDRQSVTLSAGQTSTETLTWSVPSGQTEQDYTATVASADDSETATVTVSLSSDTVFDFETGDTSRWDTSPHLSVSSGSPPFNSGSQIGRTDTGGNRIKGPLARVVPQTTTGGSQISEFEYYWLEAGSTTFGGGVRLFNSNGSVELGVATDNPEWVVTDSTGTTIVNTGGGDIFDWVRFTVTFNWGASTFDIDFKNLNTGRQETQTGFSLKQGANIEEVVLEDYNSNSGGYRTNNKVDMDWDDIRIKL